MAIHAGKGSATDRILNVVIAMLESGGTAAAELPATPGTLGVSAAWGVVILGRRIDVVVGFGRLFRRWRMRRARVTPRAGARFHRPRPRKAGVPPSLQGVRPAQQLKLLAYHGGQ